MKNFIEPRFFKYKSIPLNNGRISDIKLFKKDQIIIVSNKINNNDIIKIYIYDIITNTILLTINLTNDIFDVDKIEVLENNKIIIFSLLNIINIGENISIYEIKKRKIIILIIIKYKI